MSYTPTIALDFDGVIHNYDGWHGGKLDVPIPNAFTSVKALMEHGMNVIIFTTRDPESVKAWLREWKFPELEVTNKKPPWLVLLDDRAICFNGEWTPALVDEMVNFKPHWEAGEGVL